MKPDGFLSKRWIPGIAEMQQWDKLWRYSTVTNA
jgi:hypothetical protein